MQFRAGDRVSTYEGPGTVVDLDGGVGPQGPMVMIDVDRPELAGRSGCYYHGEFQALTADNDPGTITVVPVEEALTGGGHHVRLRLRTGVLGVFRPAHPNLDAVRLMGQPKRDGMSWSDRHVSWEIPDLDADTANTLMEMIREQAPAIIQGQQQAVGICPDFTDQAEGLVYRINDMCQSYWQERDLPVRVGDRVRGPNFDYRPLRPGHFRDEVTPPTHVHGHVTRFMDGPNGPLVVVGSPGTGEVPYRIPVDSLKIITGSRE